MALNEDVVMGITTIMEEEGVSRGELSRRMEISKPRVTQMFNHEKNWTLATLAKVANALGYSVTLQLKQE